MKRVAALGLLLFVLFILTGMDNATAQGMFELSATDVAIFAAGSEQVIGHGHYKLTHLDGLDLIEGENRYLDGEYDREEQRVRPGSGGLPPVLIQYQHRFFNPNGTPQFEESLDARSGQASCRRYDSGVPEIRESILKVPTDTYAGATQLMMLVGRLRQGSSKIGFHAFNCIPDPRIFAIKAIPSSGLIEWPMYPGKLVKLEIMPDFGWLLNLLIAPFIPRIHGWFDPSDRFQFVGGQFDRYYKSRHILVVRERRHANAEPRNCVAAILACQAGCLKASIANK